ncbi:hypothetical protein [Pseudoflavonifractor sp. 524-17]|uniref:hypothetical protein n=1 Tax=Pseudoflavonifractor sp. 524-17 TaxID=2304577 RepID=UPI00192A5788|nr:hypothetical protein [Pseudoflavonifractor sp. 524-17]
MRRSGPLPVKHFDRPANLVQKLHGSPACGVAQVVEDGGGGELGDAGEVPVLQILAGVQAAAGEDGILDAGGERPPEADLQIEFIQLLQQTAPHVIAQVRQIVPVNPVRNAVGLLHELPAKVRFRCGAVPALQRRPNRAIFLRRQFPQVGRPRPPHRAGVGHIEDVLQMRPSAAVLFDESNALGPGLHPPPHGLVPQLHTGAGGGVRPLGVDQELVVKGIFIEPGGSG